MTATACIEELLDDELADLLRMSEQATVRAGDDCALPPRNPRMVDALQRGLDEKRRRRRRAQRACVRT